MRFLGFLATRWFAAALLFVSVAALSVLAKFPEFYSPVYLLIPAAAFLSTFLCIARRFFTEDWNAKFFGSVIFHFGLLLTIAFCAAGILAGFRLTVELPYGITVNASDKRFTHVLFGEPPSMFLEFKGLESKYEKGIYPVDYAARVKISFVEKDSLVTLDETIRINTPVRRGGYQFLYNEGDFSPYFILKDAKGNILLKGHVNLSNSSRDEDSIVVKGSALTIYTRFFPDVYKEGDMYGTRSREVRNPAFGIRVVRDDEPLKDLWRGVLNKGEKVEFGTYSLEFADLKPVLTLMITSDPTYLGIMAGWVLLVAGLVVRYSEFVLRGGKRRREQ